MTNSHRRTKTVVGRTVVYADSQGPYRFVRDGMDVECVCDEDTGIRCEYHQRARKERATQATETVEGK